jgi:hypothetical protein
MKGATVQHLGAIMIITGPTGAVPAPPTELTRPDGPQAGLTGPTGPDGPTGPEEPLTGPPNGPPEGPPEGPPPAGLVNAQYWLPLEDGGPALASFDVARLEADAAPDLDGVIGGWLGASAVGTMTTYVCEQLTPGDLAAPAQAPFAYLIRLRVDPAAEDEWNRWYNEEHIPFLATVTGVLAARRFKARQPDALGRNYLAMYHLDSPDVPRTAEWKGKSDSPWSRRMKPHHQPDKALHLFKALPGQSAPGQSAPR